MDVAEWIASRVDPDPRDPGALGWAWATVDLERSQRDSGVAPDRWDPVVEDRLGARGLRLRGSEPSIVMLEPSTEGRLAGWLARHVGKVRPPFTGLARRGHARPTSSGRCQALPAGRRARRPPPDADSRAVNDGSSRQLVTWTATSRRPARRRVRHSSLRDLARSFLSVRSPPCGGVGRDAGPQCGGVVRNHRWQLLVRPTVHRSRARPSLGEGHFRIGEIALR